MKYFGRELLLTTAVLSMASAVQASEPLTIEEIHVTARKMDEKLSDVPDSISVLSAQTVENAGLTGILDYAQMAPNIVAMQGIKPGFITLTSRGITSIQENEAPMAVIIDGVTVPASDFLNQDLLDVERIEILRGPQGALYGVNAIAGAINITTRAPTNDFEGKIKGAIGNARYRKIAGLLSGPLVKDKVYFRGAASYRDEDGTIKNLFDDANVDFHRELTLHGLLRFKPTDNLRIDLRGSYVDTRAGAIYNQLTNGSVPDEINDFTIPVIDYNTQGVDNRTLKNFSMKIDWDVLGGTLTSVTGYGRSVDAVVGEGDWLSMNPAYDAHLNLPALPADFYNLVQEWTVRTKAINQEIRFSSTLGSWLKYQIGAFYQHRKKTADLLFGIAGAGDQSRHVQVPFLTQADIGNSHVLAFFGQADAALTDNLDLTIGLRYDEDRRNSDSALPPGPSTPTFVEHTFKKFQPKVSLAYHWDEDFMTYLTYSQGFRSGGFNASDTVIGSTFYPRQYQSEVATNYEAGFKATLLANRVSLNGAVFHVDYKNQQLFFPTIQGQILTNFPKSTIDGAELEMLGRLNRDFSISASYGISNSRIDAADAAGAFKGNKVPKINEYTFNASLQYDHDIGSGLGILLRADYERRGPIYWDVPNTLRTGAKNYLNLRGGIKGETWSLMAFGKNITNTRQPVEIIENFPPIGINATTRRPNQERRYGIEAIYNF